MGKVKVHWLYGDMDIDTDKNVELFIDKFPLTDTPNGVIRIILLHEPAGILDPKKTLLHLVKTFPNKYTYVLTFEEELLSTSTKAHYCLPVCPWILNYNPVKKFCVSTVVGGKENATMEGYTVRQDLWRGKDQITTPKDFYLSGRSIWYGGDYERNLVLGDSKEPMFDCQFHIAIENTQKKNFYTEKLIDCFQSRTVPIYYGAPNIGDYFNIKGIIVANSYQEIINRCNRLTPNKYDSMRDAIEDNFERTSHYEGYVEQVRSAVLKLIN